MTRDERAAGWILVYVTLNVVYYIAWWLGLPDNEFAALYYIAYGVLHLFNFLTGGFGVGVPFLHWREARKFRKSMDKELA